jgi:hypothetical protein
MNADLPTSPGIFCKILNEFEAGCADTAQSIHELADGIRTPADRSRWRDAIDTIASNQRRMAGLRAALARLERRIRGE